MAEIAPLFKRARPDTAEHDTPKRPKVVDDEEEADVSAENEDDEDSAEESEAEAEEAHKLAALFVKKASETAQDVTWKDGDSVPYSALSHTFDVINGTTKRLEISAILTRFLVEVIQKTPGDLLCCVYLCINRLCPEYEPLQLGIAEQLLMKAIAQSSGRKMDQIKKDYRARGDLGEVAQASASTQKRIFKPKPLTVASVFKTLKDIARASGAQSQARKVDLINKLLSACDAKTSEAKFLIRSLEGKLRIGLAEKTVLVSLAHAIVTNEVRGKKLSPEALASRFEEGATAVKSVYSELPSYDVMVPALLSHGLADIRSVCHMQPGIPLKPMLAKPTKAITEVLDRFEGRDFTCEYKYDGERAQVHRLPDGTIKVFSRNSEDMSVKYPDLVVQLPRCINEGVSSFVIDAEAVAWDPVAQRLLPFQELSRRKRKDVSAADITVKVHLFAFDLLYLDGETLLAAPFSERRARLRDTFTPVPGEFAFAESMNATSIEEIQSFLEASIRDGCEGLMVKMLEGDGASYEPSRRSIHWLKVKKDYLAGVGDSFDLVVIGGDHGHGKRANVYGAFHLACYDADSETYQAICKIGTGFSEENLRQFHEMLHPLELVTKKGYYDIGTSKGPDVYFEAQVVWEVLAADLSLSPVYSAARGLCSDRGISLRFPRFIRIRDDKGPSDATGPEQIAEAYRRQSTASTHNKAGGADDFW